MICVMSLGLLILPAVVLYCVLVIICTLHDGVRDCRAWRLVLFLSGNVLHFFIRGGEGIVVEFLRGNGLPRLLSSVNTWCILALTRARSRPTGFESGVCYVEIENE